MKKWRRGLCICVCALLVFAFAATAFAQETQSAEQQEESLSGDPLPTALSDAVQQGAEEQPEGPEEPQPQDAVAMSEAPSITPSVASGGNIAPNQSVTFSCADAAYEVRYTTDGTEPTNASTQGSTPVDPSTKPFTQVRAALFEAGNKVEGSEREFGYSSRNNYVTTLSLQKYITTQNDGAATGWFTRQYASKPVPGGAITMPDYYQYVAPADAATTPFYLIMTNPVDLAGIQNPALSFWMYHETQSAGEVLKPELYLEIAQMRSNGSAGAVSKVGPSISAKQATSGWQEYYIDLSEYKDKAIFWRIGVSGTNNVIVDDVKLTEMELAPVQKEMSAQEPYEDTEIKLISGSGTTVYYNEEEKCFIGNGTEAALNAGQVFSPTLKNAQRGLYYYAEQGGAKSAVNAFALPVVKTKPVSVSFSGDATRYMPGDTITLTTEQKDNGNTAAIYYSYDAPPVINEDGTAGANTWLYSQPFALEKPIQTLYAVAYVKNMEQNVSAFPINYDKLNNVKASIPSGTVVTQGTPITLSADEGCTIRYTLDGSTPSDTNGMVYTQPIVIHEETMLIACALKQGYANSKVSSFVYPLNGEGDIYEPNNTPDYATSLGFPFRLEANLYPQGDVDYYSFDVPTAARLEVRLELPAETKNSSLQLLDANGALVKTAYGEAVKTISHEVETGKYFVRIEGSASLQPYQLNVTKQASEGLDLSENNMLTTMLHSKSPISWDIGMINGGSYVMTAGYLSTWRGPVYEEEDPYNGSVEVLTIDPKTGATIVDETKVLYKPMQPRFHFQNGIVLPVLAEDEGFKHIKNAIYTYGAANVNYSNSFKCWNQNTYHYLPGGVNPGDIGGHGITVVGWDDTIPKETFAVTIDGTEYTPPADGGFIIKNSWGTSFGEDGYGYISYYSSGLGSNNPAVFILDELPGNYNTIYEHDQLGRTAATALASNVVFMKNVFQAKNDEDLRAVSFYTTAPNQIYDVYVKVGDAPQEHIARGSNVYPGYMTLRFDNSISIPKNESFEISVRLENTDKAIMEIALEYPIAGQTSKVSASPGQSFYGVDGINWLDIGIESGANVCIKAFTQNDASSEMSVATTAAEDTIHKLYTIEEINAMPEMADMKIESSSISASDDAHPYSTGYVDMQIEGDDFSMEELAADLPARFDMRDTGAVTSVKNQDRIGSCWTFAAMGSIESVFMRNNNTAFTHPTNVILSKTNEEVTLSGAQRTADVSAKATITPNEVGTDRVLWSYAGDLDSIDIKTTASRSGEEPVLFTAKATGTITVTAQSASDVNRKATMTVKIVDNSSIPGGEGKEIVTLPVGADGSYDEALLKTILSNLTPNQALLIRTVNGALIPASVFEQIQGQDKTIIFQIMGSDGRPLLNMCFNGRDITKPLPLNLTFSNTPSAGAKGAWKTNDTTLFLNFGHSGELPGKATVSVMSVPPFATGESLYLYYYNAAQNKYEDMVQSISVNEQGYGVMTLTHCSEYALTNKKQVTEKTAEKATPPSTGDGKDVTAWILLAILGAGALLTVLTVKIIKGKKHKNL